MLRGILFCALACGVITPAMAGERDLSTVRAAPVLAVSLDFPGHDEALTVGGAYVVRFSGPSAPSLALADFESLMVPRFDIGIVDAAQPFTLSHYSAIDLPAPDAWRLTDPAAVPATLDGYTVVREAMMTYRKPRAFRPRPLSAMLVLRIDGKTESPPLSIGGGGLATALWGVLPR